MAKADYSNITYPNLLWNPKATKCENLLRMKAKQKSE
jgi:hypothetical protein